MSLRFRSKNPDILMCLANLSSDEVFTPPKTANDMLDLLPQELFRSPETKFLDPACKSGVFLREIVKRLIIGLEDKIPDLQERVNHIMRNQVYGIAVTELTAMISRRTVYCSMNVKSRFSVCKFDDNEGRIRFRKIQHTYGADGHCRFCGTRKREDEGEENHAYEFIHTVRPEEIWDMKFDVIISNPPYQMSTASRVGAQATPIYHKFVEQAKKLNPKYIVMILPARWMNGGFGLDKFREDMLNDRHIRVIHDYLNSEECFPGVDLAGGVCYFLRDRDSEGKCQIVSHRDNHQIITTEGYLLNSEANTFIRFSEALSILAKINKFHEKSFADIVSPRDPFGLNYYDEKGREIMFKLWDNQDGPDKIRIYHYGGDKDNLDYAERKYITNNAEAVGKYKIFISKANGAATLNPPYAVLSVPFIGEPDTVCSMTYLLIGPFDDRQTANNVISYITTKFFRFLVSMLKNTQNAYRQVYQFVPMQDFSRSWTDEDLYAKYSLTPDEIAFIDSMIRPMNLKEDSDS